ncbi:type IV pilus assembly protein PilB [Desulfobaculum xiamenense]|uniref:Type IV pilus assembly protein PilB n=1 Tax=Desulfobaculum xiamenense TaxID=995050 RepID=A0A846QKA9_9BACT|nr:ATPase, T2SS/T4P/T4SS family [Desulfobaculum xiamenense]NJB68571.1 type IV pilus assembly protein PilB [Desulfobaculum xiamenense]
MTVRKRMRLGEMLVQAGLLDDKELPAILKDQSSSGLRLGQYLVQKGFLKESQIVELVSRQLKIPTYKADTYPVEVGAENLVPADLAQKHNLVPLQRKGRLLTVAMSDPMDINAIDAVEIFSNLEVDPIICTERELQELTYATYGIQSDLDDVLGAMENAEIQTDENALPEAEQDLAVDSLEGMASEAPVVKLLNSILSQAVREGASDVHISPEKNYIQLRFRVDGKLREIPAPPKSYFLPLVSRVKILAHMDIAVSRIPQDGRFSFQFEKRDIHVRASSLPTIHGENIILRLLARDGQIANLEDLGMADADRAKVLNALHKPYGMILTTGPTGSGKSTSLYAALKRLNQPDINIITLEDPVEYRVAKIRQVQLNRRAGMTFASGLRSILRQDPDVILVGEIRDGETAGIAVQAAMTGHRLLSTLHTNDASGAVTRLIDMGIEPFLVASTLLVSIAQRLLRRNCPHCLEEYQPPAPALRAMGLPETGQTYLRGTGCRMCKNTGYSGRIAVFEVLEIDEQIQDMIMARASSADITRAAMEAGKLHTLKQDAAEKVLQGITTLEEAASTVLI